jgi:hypothetical protein
MRRLLLLLVLVAGCDKWGHRISKMEDFGDELCACAKDVTCARRVHDEYVSWHKAMIAGEDKVDVGPMPTSSKLSLIRIPADKKPRYDEARARIDKCWQASGAD